MEGYRIRGRQCRRLTNGKGRYTYIRIHLREALALAHSPSLPPSPSSPLSLVPSRSLKMTCCPIVLGSSHLLCLSPSLSLDKVTSYGNDSISEIDMLPMLSTCKHRGNHNYLTSSMDCMRSGDQGKKFLCSIKK